MRRRIAGGAVIAMAAAAVAALSIAPAQALDPVNPVRIDLDGHPANSGFLVFVEGDISLNSDESEGTMAAGGDLHLRTSYNIAAGAEPIFPTFRVPVDARQTYLYVGGGVTWSSSPLSVNVENGGFSKIADTSTYDAYNVDNNGASVNYRVVPKGAGYLSTRFLDGRTPLQTPASIAAPVPDDLIDVPGAFDLYRGLTQDMAACPDTVTLTDAQDVPTPRPVQPGTSARFELTAGETNVLELTSAELANLSELTFVDQPDSSTPLLVNVTGASYDGNIPNLAGVSGRQAPYILWNFPDASTITVSGGDTIEGTIYAPNATLTWQPTLNIEGNVIAADFNHGVVGRLASPREVHDFPFDTTLDCAAPDDTGELTLVKEVVNDDGGTAEPGDWILSAVGDSEISGPSGSDDVTDVEVPPATSTCPSRTAPTATSRRGGPAPGETSTTRP